MDFDYKMVIVARKDLKLSAGKLAAQVGHAAVDCAVKAQKHQPEAFRRWHEEGQKKVVLRSDGQDDLYELKVQAEALGLTTSIIADAGRTELPPGTVTVLGVGPGKARDVDKATGHLKLY